MKRFLCFIGFHSWTRWEICTITSIFKGSDKKYQSEGQKRYCSACGIKELRDV